jgi:ABC-type lipoprotein release transport system permease subunit
VEELGVGLGGRVVLTASDVDGEVTRALFHLTGVIRTGTRALDEILAYTTVEAAREAVSMDDKLTQIGVLAGDGHNPIELAGAIAAALDDLPQDLEVLPWQEAVPEMVGFTELDDAFGYVYMAVIFLVVLFSIANTFLMAVLERVRELGLLSALGLRGRRVAHLLLAETALMTVLAMGIGFAVGFAGHLAAAQWGISVAMWGLEEIEISGIDMADLVIYSEIRPFKWFMGSALVAVATIASSLYPAWRASRLAPAEAMRFFE